MKLRLNNITREVTDPAKVLLLKEKGYVQVPEAVQNDEEIKAPHNPKKGSEKK